ncbi:hypothetical protein GCM10010451_68050 [Streptomyces virens]|uniref:Uncharacterized protein n=1 Tax=Streptomyces virens TaxID=285572 RepID=A0ABN3V0M9_9ACTN
MHECQRADEGEQLQYTGEFGCHLGASEPLREEQGEDETAQQGDGHDQADDVLGGHSFVTPRATRATSAKTAIVTTTKAESAIVGSWNQVDGNGPSKRNACVSGIERR